MHEDEGVLEEVNQSKHLTSLSSHVASFQCRSVVTLLFWVSLVYLVSLPDLAISISNTDVPDKSKDLRKEGACVM